MSLDTPSPWNAVAQGYDVATRPMLEFFSERALTLASVQPGARVLDVACGPGTLTVRAASIASHVLALDFSDEMLTRCRARVAELGDLGDRVAVQLADGQALELEADFDAAFSMFGLMFFADRAAGFAGLRRALRPGAVGVVSCWVPFMESSAMRQMGGVYMAAFPGTPPPPANPLALDSAEKLRAEMSAAGFVDVEVHRVAQRLRLDGPALWASVADGFAPVAQARQTMDPEVWAAAESRGLAWIAEEHDPDTEVEFVAYIGVGHAPGGS
jgi:SAM-dependent methyltransferase